VLPSVTSELLAAAVPDDLPVVGLQAPDESPEPRPRKRRAAILGVAAAVFVVAGVAVVADRYDSKVETEPATPATTPERVPSPTPPDPTPPREEVGPPPSVVDSLGYRWSRVPDRDWAFAYAGIFEPGFGGHDRGTYSESAERSMASVTVGGPGLVAVGSSGVGGALETDNSDAAVWISDDGVTWSPVSHIGSALGGQGDQGMTSVTVGGPGLVAVGSDRSKSVVDGVSVWSRLRAAVWTSVDGLTWSRVPHDDAVFGLAGAQEMTSVTVGGPGLVAVGSQSLLADTVPSGNDPRAPVPEEGDLDAAVWVSVDGITWSRVPHDESIFGGSGHQAMTSVTAGGPGLVAVGTDGLDNTVDAAVWTSVDGVTWSRVPDDAAVLGGENSQHMASVVAGGPGLVAVGFDGVLGEDLPHVHWTSTFLGEAAVWTSVDGTTWSRVSDDAAVFGGASSQQMSSVTAGGPGLVAVGTDGSDSDLRSAVWTSVDGITWSRVPDDETVFGGASTAGPHGAEMTGVTTWRAVLLAVGRVDACCFDTGASDAAVWIATLDD
jgi:hypothetical protein